MQKKLLCVIVSILILVTTFAFSSTAQASGLQASYSCSNTYKAFNTSNYLSKTSGTWQSVTTKCMATYYDPTGTYNYYIARAITSGGTALSNDIYIDDVAPYVEELFTLNATGINASKIYFRIKNAYYHYTGDETHRLVITGGCSYGTLN
jgi:hypothetical protein